MVSVTLLI